MKLEGKWKSIESIESVKKIQRFFRVKNFQVLVEKQMFISKNRGRAVKELISTEKTYLASLLKLRNRLIDPLRQIRKKGDVSVGLPLAPSSPIPSVNSPPKTSSPSPDKKSPQLYYSQDSALKREEEATSPRSKTPVLGFRSLSVQDLLKKFDDKPEEKKDDASHCFDNETEEETVAFLHSCFDNIEDIIKLQTEFYEEIEKRMLTWTPSKPFADIFVNHVPQMILYTEYINHYDRMMASIDILCTKNKSFKSLMDSVAKEEGISTGGKYVIMDLTITPIQRMPRYQLLWNEILKLTPSYHPDHINVREALKKVTELNSMINENKRLHEMQIIEAKRLKKTPSSSVLTTQHASMDQVVRKLDHEFVRVKLLKPTWCSICKNFVWGIARSGYQCTACDCTVHKVCLRECKEMEEEKHSASNKKMTPFRVSSTNLLSPTQSRLRKCKPTSEPLVA